MTNSGEKRKEFQKQKAAYNFVFPRRRDSTREQWKAQARLDGQKKTWSNTFEKHIVKTN